jgi:hypothetical protein
VADEMLRVCRPGGTVGMLNFTPFSRYSPHGSHGARVARPARASRTSGLRRAAEYRSRACPHQGVPDLGHLAPTNLRLDLRPGSRV